VISGTASSAESRVGDWMSILMIRLLIQLTVQQSAVESDEAALIRSRKQHGPRFPTRHGFASADRTAASVERRILKLDHNK